MEINFVKGARIPAAGFEHLCIPGDLLFQQADGFRPDVHSKVYRVQMSADNAKWKEPIG